MQILKVKDNGSSYKINDGEFFIPKEGGRKDDIKAVEAWIDEGGIVEAKFSLQEIKDKKNLEIKSQANSRIISRYPDYKQRNLNGAVAIVQNKEILALKAGSGNYTPTEEDMTSLRAAKACKDFIDGIRAKSNELEASLDSMTEEQLNAFDPSEDSNWE